jgi:hypothetical protein
MQDKTRKSDIPSERDKIREALYGGDEDFDDLGYAEEFLSAIGQDPTEVLYDFKAYLELAARLAQEQSGSIPRELSETLRTLRSQTVEFVSLNMKPDEWVAGMLAGSVASRPTLQTTASLRRKEGQQQLSKQDKDILEGLANELAGRK